MATISILFSDGHEFKTEVSQDSMETVIESYIEEYESAHPGVTATQRVYMGDKVEQAEDEESEEESLIDENGELKESLDFYHEDHQYVQAKYADFLGIEFIHGEMLQKYVEEELQRKVEDLTDVERYGTAFGMGKEEFLNFYNRLDIERSLLAIKYSYNISLDTEVKDVDEDKLLNILGHLNVVTSYNEERQQWQCVVPLRDGLIIHLSNTACGAGLRGLISRLTGRFINNNDVLDTITSHWTDINKAKDENPLGKDREYLDKLAASVGTSIDEIEEHYKNAVVENNNSTHPAS